jgi:hypothetical protein
MTSIGEKLTDDEVDEMIKGPIKMETDELTVRFASLSETTTNTNPQTTSSSSS